MTELIKEENAKKALANLLLKCTAEYVVEMPEDIVQLQGYFNRQALLDIILVKCYQMQENPINKECHLYQPGFADWDGDSDDLYLDGQFRLGELEAHMKRKWSDLITKAQYDAAGAYLDEHNESAWIDVTSNEDIKLDGWFTIADLEAVITMKKYLLQNPEAKTDA